ncbi:MAG: sigma-54 dependent transcriptional regulator [bacterium]|nr:sigma-54 dependent transcriptional regulator [bacterium]
MKQPARHVILIVDDEKNTREGLQKALAAPDHRILLAEDAATALRIMERERVDLVLTDLRMPGADGLELMRRATAQRPDAVVILLTAYGTVATAVQAMKQGAYDYLTKPVNLDELEMVVKRALASRAAPAGEAYGIDAIIGSSARILEIKAAVARIAPTKAAVLIEGESGTGKELIARAIHGLGDRRDRPFVAVHCAALAEGVLESELFGHERGAFTGAVRRHLGRFEMADGGTLFLDEVSEMGQGTQVKLLRVLQEREFERVGGTETVRVDVRIIAATNADLEALIGKGRFREDLYYRLNVIRIKVPPLRERREDVPLLVEAFLAEFNEANGRRVRLSPGVLRALAAYGWPGNIRELRNCIEGLVVLARGDTVEVADLPRKLREWAEAPAQAPAAGTTTLRDAEHRMIEDALRRTGGCKTEAAKILGISRRTLHRKINRYRMT